MDDLDHSMHIAEFDWTSFYDQTEECSLLQPSRACPDDLSLSDSEDTDESSSIISTGRQEKQQSPDVNSGGAEATASGCGEGEESCMNLMMELVERGTGEENSAAEGASEVCLDSPTGNTLSMKEETNDNAANALQTDTIHDQCSGAPTELKKEDGKLRVEADNTTDPSCDQMENNVNEPHTADRAENQDIQSVPPRVEKERWFVTVNDSPAQKQVRTTSMKKKRRQKKLCKNSHSLRSQTEEKSHANGVGINKGKYKPGEKGHFPQSNQNLAQNSSGGQSLKVNPERISDLLQMANEEENVSGNLTEEVISYPILHNNTESTTDRNKHQSGSSASSSHDTCTPEDSSQLESPESEEFEDGAEFFSVHSYDSESYLSAAELIEENQSGETTQPLCSAPLSTDTDSTHDRPMHSYDSTSFCTVAFINPEHTDAHSTLTFPPALQRASEMPHDSSACDNDTHSTHSHTPGLERYKINLSASSSSAGEQLNPLPAPDLTATPLADSPEAYAKAAGHTRPVYAISDFWDEMEKLTINDILQLRMGRRIPPWETHNTGKADGDESPMSHGDPVGPLKHNMPPDGGLMDTLDNADSDYCTQPDESKPDRSSCEFSMSDFEEEYWQFIGANRNPSPDPQSKSQRRTNNSTFLSQEGEDDDDDEEESSSSDRKETPVPLEDGAQRLTENQESHRKPSLATQTTNESMHNLQTLNQEDLTLQISSDGYSQLLSSCLSLEEDAELKVSDSLETLMPAPFFSSTALLDDQYQISLPDVFEHFSTEDAYKDDTSCVAVYDPEDMSAASVFSYSTCTLWDEMSYFSFQDSQCSDGKPIPIFSCSHRKIRELTFAKLNYPFMSADHETQEELESLSPIRVVSHCFINANQCGTSKEATGKSPNWKSFMSIRKIRFHDKGSIWCRRSGAWVFPVEAEKIERQESPVTALMERRDSSSPSKLFRELEIQQSVLGTIQTRQQGIFSTLQQADMCLVCIAFASWVIRSSDPEAADTWKAALLANVSALSAIQYLRQYVRKTTPLCDDH
ncbi:uncharacterized protein perm1b [Echeneis naucrates]|uniref:uncharacterized protein perm1b n=1 Tax=Echeneis naucrates TaxID=173247 RepID=UPI0011134AAD|nr:uncharacterized protein LOC115044109 [Echeneis naucrates]